MFGVSFVIIYIHHLPLGGSLLYLSLSPSPSDQVRISRTEGRSLLYIEINQWEQPRKRARWPCVKLLEPRSNQKGPHMTCHLRKEIIAPSDLRQSRLREHDEQGNGHNLANRCKGRLQMTKARLYQGIRFIWAQLAREDICTNSRSTNREMDVCSSVAHLKTSSQTNKQTNKTNKQTNKPINQLLYGQWWLFLQRRGCLINQAAWLNDGYIICANYLTS